MDKLIQYPQDYGASRTSNQILKLNSEIEDLQILLNQKNLKLQEYETAYNNLLKTNKEWIEKSEAQEKNLNNLKKEFKEKEEEIKKIMFKLNKELLVYTTGAGFIELKNLNKIKTRIRTLGFTNQHYSLNQQTTFLISGIIRNPKVNHKFKPDYRIWCMSVIKSVLDYFNSYPQLYPLFEEKQIINVLEMINEELLKNGKKFEVGKEKYNLFLEVKSLMSDYYSKLDLYNDMPKKSSRLIQDGEEGRSYREEYPINEHQINKLSQEIKNTLNTIKNYLNKVYGNLEEELYKKEEKEDK